MEFVFRPLYCSVLSILFITVNLRLCQIKAALVLCVVPVSTRCWPFKANCPTVSYAALNHFDSCDCNQVTLSEVLFPLVLHSFSMLV